MTHLTDQNKEGKSPSHHYRVTSRNASHSKIFVVRSRQLLPCPEDCPSRMYAFMVECWHEIPNRRPPFGEIHARLRQWEGVSGVGGQGVSGYQPSVTSHSHQSSSTAHSSTGPSNNTGSTNLSNQQMLQMQHRSALKYTQYQYKLYKHFFVFQVSWFNELQVPGPTFLNTTQRTWTQSWATNSSKLSNNGSSTTWS